MDKKNYELVVIFAPELTKENLEAQVEKTKSLLTEKGAESISVENWGVRKIACVLKKRTTAHYVVYRLASKNNKLTTDLTTALRINEHVLKFQFHTIADKKRGFKGNPLKLKEKEAAPAAA